MLTQLNTHIGLCKLAIARFTKYSVSPWADKNNEMQHPWQLSSLLQWVDNCYAPLSLLSLSCKYEFKKFSQELTLYTSNREGVDRIVHKNWFRKSSWKLRHPFVFSLYKILVCGWRSSVQWSVHHNSSQHCSGKSEWRLMELFWRVWLLPIKHDSISKFILYIYACLLRAGIMIIWNRQLFTSLDCQNSMWGIRGFHVMASNSQPRDVTQI